MIRPLIIAVFCVLLTDGPATAAGGPTIDPSKIVTPKFSAKQRLGKLAYDAKCAVCHGKDTAGTNTGPPFLHKVYHPGHHGDASFFRATVQGARAHHWPFGDMPKVEGVSKPMIINIIKYVRAMQKANGIF